MSCYGHIDGMGGREGRELVGAIERTTVEAGGGYQHCIKIKIFFGAVIGGGRYRLEGKLARGGSEKKKLESPYRVNKE